VLAFHLARADLCGPPWRWDGDRCRRDSWIAPLAHPLLEHGLLVGVGRILVWTRERTEPAATVPGCTAGTDDERIQRIKATDGEYLIIQLDRDTVRIHAGPYGTAPLYLAAGDRALDGSWDITTLRNHCRADHLVDRVLTRVLTRQHRYGADTPFAGIRRLTERATATWDPDGLRLRYPAPAPHIVWPRRVREGVDPIDSFGQVLGRVVGRYPTSRQQAAVELSGGADSANVALSLAEHHGRPRSVGLVLAGELGRHQKYRRDTIARRLRLHDHAVTAHRYPPFSIGGLRSRLRPHDPTGDFYLEAFQALARHAADAGVRVLFTGFGGDELMALRPDESSDRRWTPPCVPWLGSAARAALADIDTDTAPVAPVPLATLIGLAARNPGYLRQGIWPLSPLVDPLLVRFAESLPTQWRRGKELLRDRLRRAGLPHDVAEPAQPENFLPLMQDGLRRFGLPYARKMLSGSLLVDTGHIDPDRFADALRRAEQAAVIPDILYDTVALEVGLRSMLETR
jgi:hypothetical protein